MPPRKAAKLSSISTSREALPDSDNEEQHNMTTTEWVKLTSRLVDRDVRAVFRYGKKSQFVEEDEEIEVSSKPLGNFSISSAQSAHFAAWIESANGVQDDIHPTSTTMTTKRTYLLEEIGSPLMMSQAMKIRPTMTMMSHRRWNTILQILWRRKTHRCAAANLLLVLSLTIQLTRPKLFWTGFLYATLCSTNSLDSMVSKIRRTVRAAL